MGILTDNPVLRREVRARLRLRRLTASKPLAWIVGLTSLVIVYFYIKGLIAIGRGDTQTARELWAYLLLSLLLLVVILAPALLSTAITQEREQQTWEALTTTRLTAAEVLLGKWLARLSLTGLPLLVLLPFLIGCAVRGGVGISTNLSALLFLALTAGFYGVLGLLCSFLARRTVTATVAALTIAIFLCVGTPILAALTAEYVRAASTDYSYRDPVVLWINPFYALTAFLSVLEPHGVGMIGGPGALGPQPPGSVVAFYLITSLLAIAAGLSFMAARFRHAARDQ
ncbi:MAG: ABC transporter permease subunit [Armatimonadetes bacterium]|nr:ABC transporter permease subunit [Armatimonadota bacterium]